MGILSYEIDRYHRRWSWQARRMRWPDQQRVDKAMRRELIARGYRMIVVRWHEGFETTVGHYPEVFRGN